KLNKNLDFIYRKNYNDMNLLIEKGDVDIAFICTGAYVSLNDNYVDILAVPEVKGRTTYNSLFIVNKNLKIKDLGSLMGKTIAFTDPLSNSGYIYPIYYLITKGIKNRNYFKKVYYTYSHDKSIIMVNKGVVDAAFVDNMVYKYMAIKSKEDVKNIDIIDTSHDMPNPPVVVNKNFADKDIVKKLFLNMHTDPEGKSILKELNIDRFVDIERKKYEIIIKMKKTVDEHLKNESAKIF
ncbi:MAG: phosphate/phosphite/phosphonate ABC transporter substrate-binding protein, partial [Calditerrivibrio sp.]|nr:phosphate/phosphite/phosphonate ABC transporter substrate-binding protein [Calditerrivibrio sp.]